MVAAIGTATVTTDARLTLDAAVVTLERAAEKHAAKPPGDDNIVAVEAVAVAAVEPVGALTANPAKVDLYRESL
jgi:hypothetical protein